MSQVIIEDTRQQRGKHEAKHRWWRAHGVEFIERAEALPFGDYMVDGSNVCVDTKRSIDEIAMDLGRDHDRTAREADRAINEGWRLVFLIEAPPNYRTVEDLRTWTNTACFRCNVRRDGMCRPHVRGRCIKYDKNRKLIQGDELVRKMKSFQDSHRCQFAITSKDDAARAVCEILGVRYDDKGD